MNSDTRSLLVLEAERIVRQRGYAGFSYADLSARVGIRKASIHHHFPAKEDLGVALVQGYTARMRAAMADIAAAHPGAIARVAGYAGLYRDALAAGMGCLCGVLAAEFLGLPDQVRAAVRLFFGVNTDWLTDILAEGQRAGAIRRDIDSPALADHVMASLQGAAIVGQGEGSTDRFERSVAALLKGLQAEAA